MVKPLRISAAIGRGTSSAEGVRPAFRRILANYQRLVDHLQVESAQVLYEALEPTFEKANIYCPKDKGELVRSGYLEIVARGKIPTVEIGYGKGGYPPYATAVHENLEWRHKAPTRAKWLQVALAEDAPAIQGRIVSGLKVAGGF